MLTRLIALTALLGCAVLIAPPLAGATPGTTSSSGGTSGGGGGGGHGGGGGGGHGGGGGGSPGGGHFASGGHFGGGRFVGSAGYRGGGYGGSAARASYRVRGGYVAHGSYAGQRGDIAQGDYRIVGLESGGLVHTAAAVRGGHSGQIMVLGPRTGSAAKALRLDGVARMGRRPPPQHPPQPKRPHHNAAYDLATAHESTQEVPPPFCDFNVPTTENSPREVMDFGCPGAVRAPVKVKAGH